MKSIVVFMVAALAPVALAPSWPAEQPLPEAYKVRAFDAADDVVLEAMPETLETGRLAVIDVIVAPTAAPITRLAGTFGGRRAIVMSTTPDGRRWRVLAPVNIDGHTGPRELTLEGVREPGTPLVLSRDLEVRDGVYDEREITVDRKFTSPSRAQSRRAKAESRELDHVLGAVTAVRLWRGSFARPTSSQETSPFGTLRTYNGARRNRHLGLDLDGVIGDPVAASQSGKVVLAKDRFYSGGTVVIDHGEGLFTMYFHFSQIGVKAGQHVEKGERIGSIGATGQVTGPHLHFSVRAQGLYVDPAAVLVLDLSDDPLDAPPPTVSPRRPALHPNDYGQARAPSVVPSP